MVQEVGGLDQQLADTENTLSQVALNQSSPSNRRCTFQCTSDRANTADIIRHMILVQISGVVLSDLMTIPALIKH